ncbi:MAG: hypothetical protein QG656_2410, partial [Candidatus Hydrogenedentes bacterium]|nr:hypothetical protein [Candidatus Hydrogenedentota bacterium]
MESLKKRIVVIGGVAAGPKAASRARRLDQSAEITLIQREQDLSMASCGYPYYVGGWFNDRNQLLSAPTGAVRNPGFFQNVKNITALVNTEAESIDRAAHTVACRNLDTGEMRVVEYDKLVIATGAKAVVPPIPGVQLEGITTLQSMRDTDYLRRACENGKGTKAVIVGGGLIGVEAAEALTKSGIDVTLVEMLPQILSFLDVDLSMLAANHMRAKGVDVRTGDGVTEFLGEDGRVTSVRLASGVELACGLVVLAVGVRPNTQLAAKAGLALGARGGIQVDEYLQTSDPDIYAAGDCIEIPHRLTGKPVLAPLGDLANLE